MSIFLVGLYIFLAIFSKGKVTGVILDPKKDTSYSYCAGSTEPLILNNPFPDILKEDYPTVLKTEWFIHLEWYHIPYSTGKEKLVIIYSYTFRVHKENIHPYQTWGLQINNAHSADSGVYSARLVTITQSDYRYLEWKINITVVDYPKLKSEKFTTDVRTNANGSKTYFCGQLSTLGEPPVNILWKTENGTILPSSYSDGFQWLEEPAITDFDKVYCELNKTSPSYLCIPSNDMARWDETYTGEVATGDSNMMVYIIAGCAGGVGLIVAIIVIVFICKKRDSGEKYNARGKENKSETDGEQKSRLMSSSGEVESSNSHERSYREKKTPNYRGGNSEVDSSNSNEKSHQQKKTPIYKGASSNNSPTPRHSYPRYQHESQDDYEAYEMNGKGKTPENVAPPPVAPKYRKKSEPLIDAQGNDVRPPTKKPRSIFLTPSMEELDKINEAVRGGKGSQPPGTMV